MDKSYSFLGQEILLTKERAQLVEHMRPFLASSLSAKEEFEKSYRKSSTLDDALQAFDNQVSKVIEKEADRSVSSLTKVGIYDIDERDILDQADEELADARKHVHWLEEALDSLHQDLADTELRRAEKPASGGFIGGGFGTEGIMQGIAIATVANGVFGIAGRLSDAALNASDRRAASKIKKELFKNEKTYEDLTAFLAVIPQIFGRLSAGLLQNADGLQIEFDLPNDEDRRKCNSILSNLKLGRISEGQRDKAFANAIALDPFNAEIWETILDVRGDPNGELARTAFALGAIDIASAKQQRLNKFRAGLATSTSDACGRSIEELKIRAKQLGLDAERELNDLTKLAEQLGIQERTYGGRVFESRIEAENAADQDAIATQLTYRGVSYDSEEDAKIAALERTRATSIFTWIAIVLLPTPSAFVTLKSGFSNRQRALAFSWLAFRVFLVFYGNSFVDGRNDIVFHTLGGIVLMGIAAIAIRVELWIRLRVDSWSKARTLAGRRGQ